MPLARRALATAPGVDGAVEVDGPDDLRALRPGRRRTASRTASCRPRCTGDSTSPTARRPRPVEPAVAGEPVELVGEQEQRRDGRGVVGLVLAGVVHGGGEVEERGNVAGRRRRSRATRARRARGHRGDPEPAVGGEALLRREVVDVDLGRVDGQAAGTAGGVDQRPARRRRRRRSGEPAPSTPVEVSLCGHRVDVDARLGDRVGERAGVGAHDGRVGEQRRAAGVTRRTSTRTRRSTGAAARSPDQAERGGVPERGRAAVAEHDLVAVGQRRTARPGRSRTRRTSALTGACRWEVPR